jgi:hypothetical protein
MNADDARLVHNFMRLTQGDGESRLEIAVVEWSGPHSPTLRWETYRTWSRPPSPEQLSAAHRSALQEPRFFNVCSICGERNNAGHMHDTNTCQGCAERHLGVVY